MKTTIAACLVLLVAPFSAWAVGELDPTFADNGTLVMQFDPASAQILDVEEVVADGLVDASGRYVSVGYANVEDPEAAIYEPFGQITRHLPSGERDLTLAGAGLLRYKFASPGNTEFSAVAETGEKKLVVGGTILSFVSEDEAHYEPVVCRILENGSRDPSFGTAIEEGQDGCHAYGDAFPWQDSKLVDLDILPQGKILLLLSFHQLSNTGPSYALVRLLPDGTLDSTFGDEACPQCGYALSPAFFSNYLKPIAFSSHGTYGIAVASHMNLFGGAMMVSRHVIDGGIDEAFSAFGTVVVDFDDALSESIGVEVSSSDEPSGIEVMVDGSILIGGTARPSGMALNEGQKMNQVAMAKILPDGVIDNSFGNRQGDTPGSARFVERFAEPGQSQGHVSGFTVQPDGKIIIAGYCTTCKGQLDAKMLVARVRKDGAGYDEGWGSSLLGDDTTFIEFDALPDVQEEQAFDNKTKMIPFVEDGRVVIFGHVGGESMDLSNFLRRKDPFITRLKLENTELFSDSFDY